jgi:serine/threonine protein kinase
MELKVDQIIDGFTLIRRLGSGATADVWQVTDASGKIHALKMYSPQQRLDKYSVELFMDEFRTSLSFNHPNIVAAEAMGVFEDRPYIIMQFCPSSLDGELKRRILERRHGQQMSGEPYFSEQELALILNHVAWGTDYIHKQGVVHNDIKPANILIDEFHGSPTYKITDFGISTRLRQTILQQSQAIESYNKSLTPSYAAPEKFSGKLHKRSDIFSLGVMMYELATGKLPTHNDQYSIGELLLKGHDIPKLDEVNLSGRFKELIERCLHPDHRSRPETADIINLTKVFLTKGFWPTIDVSTKGTKDDHSIVIKPRKPKKKLKFNRKAIALVILALLVVASIIGYSSVRRYAASSAKLFQSGNFNTALSINRKIGWLFPKAKKQAAAWEKLQISFVYMRPFNEHALTAARTKDGKWGFVNKEGEVKIPPEFDYVGNFTPSLPVTYYEANGVNGFLREDGKRSKGSYPICSTSLDNDGAQASFLDVDRYKTQEVNTLEFE